MSDQVNTADTIESPHWWEGGNLHDKTMEEWLDASNQNRMATSLDIIIALKEDLSTTIEFSSREELMRYVLEFTSCITGTAVGGEQVWALKVADVALVCARSLGYLPAEIENSNAPQ